MTQQWHQRTPRRRGWGRKEAEPTAPPQCGRCLQQTGGLEDPHTGVGWSRRDEFTDRNSAQGTDSEVTGSIPTLDTYVADGSADELLHSTKLQYVTIYELSVLHVKFSFANSWWLQTRTRRSRLMGFFYSNCMNWQRKRFLWKWIISWICSSARLHGALKFQLVVYLFCFTLSVLFSE